jgi:cytochrome P450
MPIRFDPFTDLSRDDPAALYRELRDEAPVHWSPEGQVYCISRYDDVLAALKDVRTFSSSAMQTVLLRGIEVPITPRYALILFRFFLKTRMNPLRIPKAGNLISLDPPRHDTMRKIVARGFTPRSIAAWEERTRTIVADAISAIEAKTRFDVVQDLAIPLPTTIIAEMLGIEPSLRNDFKRWSDVIITVASGSGVDDLLNSGAVESLGELYAYLRERVRERRRSPEDDLISLLVDPKQDGVLDEFEVVQFVVLLLVAGNETTTNLIGNAVHALLDRPDQVEIVRGEPAYIQALVEEAVRFDSPLPMVFRTATRDVAMAGTTIPRGAEVACLLASANRDERRFEDPDRFDVMRETTGHLGFGFGAHFCLGASLARLEASVALEAILPLLSSFERSTSEPELIPSFFVRGRVSLELISSKSEADSRA